MSTFVPFPEEKGVEPLKEVLSRVMFSRGWGKVSSQARLESIWKEVVGPGLQSFTQAQAIKRGVLEVQVQDAMVHQQLVMRKAELLAAMQDRLGPQIKNLRMRVG
jgi:predicted nucleic acid-binding Zn ribbon protein